MNIRWHSARARDLIQACDGLTDAAAHCRVSAAQLSDYNNPNKACTMPADVILDLEAYCGRPVYSSALAGVSGAVAPADDLICGAVGVSAGMANLVQKIVEALGDQHLSERERRDLDAHIGRIKTELAAVEAVIDGGGTPS
tara:strand:+ start:82 stop:504 length:423 start_codon:yes stop_codon:yes gene_type:complete